jgi:hypothetical protein
MEIFMVTLADAPTKRSIRKPSETPVTQISSAPLGLKSFDAGRVAITQEALSPRCLVVNVNA